MSQSPMITSNQVNNAICTADLCLEQKLGLR